MKWQNLIEYSDQNKQVSGFSCDYKHYSVPSWINSAYWPPFRREKIDSPWKLPVQRTCKAPFIILRRNSVENVAQRVSTVRPTVHINANALAREIWKHQLWVRGWTENIFKTELSKNDGDAISLHEFSSDTDSKWPSIAAFSNYPRAVLGRGLKSLFELWKPPQPRWKRYYE